MATSEGRKLDRIDVRILEELQWNSRITNQNLAAKVALSPSACLARVRKLEADGVLQRFTADIALDKVGRMLKAYFQVTLERHDLEDMAPFLKVVKAHGHVVSCQRVCGNFDFLLCVVVRDMHQLRDLADHLLAKELGVAKLSTFPVMEEIKTFVGIPLQALLTGYEDVADSHLVAV